MRVCPRLGLRTRPLGCALLAAILLFVAGSERVAGQQDGLTRGLWVWHGPSVAGTLAGANALGDFCRAQSITEVYVSGFDLSKAAAAQTLAALVTRLHSEGVHVDVLFSSTNADEVGGHRDRLLTEVRSALTFNRNFPRARLDGVHLDVEPQQRPENKGSGNLAFLAGLVETYKEVRTLTDPASLSLSADIAVKVLEGDVQQRRSLLAAVPQVTLMLYGLSSPNDGTSEPQKVAKLQTTSAKDLAMAYQGLEGGGLATMVIGLRTPDYGDELPAMLAALDDANRANPHYRGSARHSYNDALTETQ